MNIEWKPTFYYPEWYLVSNTGLVRTKRGHFTKSKNGLLSANTNKYGYKCVTLFGNGKYKYMTVHRLVALAFIPNPDSLRTVDHIDNDKTNNRVDNLQWMSFGDNIRKSHDNRIYQPSKIRGANHSVSKLTFEQADEIRAIYKLKIGNEISQRKLAKLYGVSHAVIKRIVDGTAY